MNLFEKWSAKTPKKNKDIGRLLTVVAGALVSMETYFIANGVQLPSWVHGVIVIVGGLSVFFAALHGAKVEK